MSWLRIEGRMPQHRKVAPLSDAAFRLHITAGAWCVDEPTPGIIPTSVVPTLTRAPRGARLRAGVDELVTAGLWETRDHGYQIHDFGQWNPGLSSPPGSSQAQPTTPRTRSEAARIAGQKSAAVRRERFGSALPNGAPNAPERRSPERAPNEPSDVREDVRPNVAEPARASDPGSDPEVLETPPKDLKAGSPNDVRPNGGEGGDSDLERDYVSECPPRLLELCVERGIVAALAREHGVTEADIEEAIRQYRDHFTTGRGFGEKRRSWARQVRGRVLDLKRGGRLAGMAPAVSPTGRTARPTPRIAGPATPAPALADMPDVLALVLKPRPAAQAPRSPVDASGNGSDADIDRTDERTAAGQADGEAVANG